MTQPTPLNKTRGFVVEAHDIPAGLAARLEREGLAGMTADTVDGVYLEPRVPLGAIIEVFEGSGAVVRGFRAAGTAPSWRDGARSYVSAMKRLRDARSAEWLPTLPAA